MTVVAAYYDDPSGASAALETLQRLRKRRAIEIVDAAVMARRPGSDRLQITETAELSGRKLAAAGSVAGVMLGIIFPPSVLALGAVGAAAGAADAHFRDQGFDRNLLKEIGENLPPGGVALVAVIQEPWLADLSGAIAGHQGLTRFSIEPGMSQSTSGGV